jgi:hypothetical protein
MMDNIFLKLGGKPGHKGGVREPEKKFRWFLSAS